MSASSATAAGSRSPSPATPEASDGPEPLVVRDDTDLNSWRDSLSNGTTAAWESDSGLYPDSSKREDERILSLNDLIHNHAYDEQSLLSALDGTAVQTSDVSSTSSPLLPSASASQLVQFSNLLTSANVVPVTKPVPPPTPLARKREPSAASDRVVYPPKESCYNLPIIIPSIPEGGTKSRVETQVRVTIDLAYASSSSGEPFKYDKIGSWKWLKLPKGTSTKKRTRKEGKIDPQPEDILHLAVAVTCASPPHSQVISCSSCRTREAKRVARKIAARVRPVRSDSDSLDDPNRPTGQPKLEDTSSIIQFNCPEVVDFSTGSAILPMRITCYCRHHREKVGFHVHFTMVDHTGRIVGSGTTHPIMITDDHKSTNKQGGSNENSDWTHVDQTSELNGSKRKLNCSKDGPAQVKKRARAQERSADASSNVSRAGSVGDLTSLSPTLPSYLGAGTSLYSVNPSLFPGSDASESETYLPSPSNSHASTNENISDAFRALEAVTRNMAPTPQQAAVTLQNAVSPTFLPTAPPSPIPQIPMQMQPTSMLAPQTLPFLFNFNPDFRPPATSLPPPKIHRLIPASGPTYGGIEVTILGMNFHPSMQLNCVFGDAVASSTHRWSDNTLVCLLPPRVSAGVVAVWFEGIEKDDSMPPTMFTYIDESDRALMELALQVVGLKMTGKLEDAKNVAMRIVGNAGPHDSQNGDDQSIPMQVAALAALSRANGLHGDIEQLVIKLLSILDTPSERGTGVATSDAISLQSSSGHTLLHLATFLKFSSLVKFLLEHDIDPDVRDQNGFTAAHFAAITPSKECLRLLVRSGAALDIVNVGGEIPEEIAPPDLFDDLYAETDSDREWSPPGNREDEEATWGDVEDDSEEEARSATKRAVRRGPPEKDHESHGNPSSEYTPATQSKSPTQHKQDGVDEKQAASLVEMIQRTLAQFQPAQGIMPHVPHIGLPHIPGMPNVPWGALPQLPVVFPVYVPLPGLANFLTERRSGSDKDKDSPVQPRVAAVPSVPEWFTVLERWTKQYTARQEVEENPPPAYTPRQAHEGTSVSKTALETQPLTATARPERNIARRLKQDTPFPDEEVDAYTYKPPKKRVPKGGEKHDRMLILFWIPMLIFGFMWAFLTVIRIGIHVLRATVPLRMGIRFMGA
ncbi:hypothetical protein GLOTRDRAFT_73813 [Gloeophyllum trabeum ATCC 11539]|uniref:IPT/TIG domain-containing protein n=1 Tax=Gloeophyllum trabeum (strain ATCC 11539 / FP-39264 / Madison 617) TaxID=670483 RepID=S7QCV9_GLOTA|nr:uncharacterized protein GLOTRDRAFT_73813 [Gloeophyllum trabeum ATCC 11539]EPQ57192.1 hypothetical protein GLOTRDRAFT_73813 [Gloeophyllum trabeum ATCC 11539]